MSAHPGDDEEVVDNQDGKVRPSAPAPAPSESLQKKAPMQQGNRKPNSKVRLQLTKHSAHAAAGRLASRQTALRGASLDLVGPLPLPLSDAPMLPGLSAVCLLLLLRFFFVCVLRW